MPIYNARIQQIDESETRRYAGLAASSRFPDNLISEACIDARTMALPQATWNIYPYDMENNIILGAQALKLQGNDIVEHLAGAVKVAIVAVTIGGDLEAKSNEYFLKGEYSKGLLLDAAGTAAVEAAADEINKLINQEVKSQGYNTRARFSPGYGDWDITVQPNVLLLADGESIGITVTSTCMLLPRKSITALIPLIPQNYEQSYDKTCSSLGCSNCKQKDCLARKE